MILLSSKLFQDWELFIGKDDFDQAMLSIERR